MESTSQLIFICGLLLCAAIISSFVSRRIGAPLLVTVLGVGILFGEDGPGGFVFNDAAFSYLACSFALAIILFDSGVHTQLKNFRQALRPAAILASLGVIVTTAIIGLGMWPILGTDPLYALLLGAIVASTDAAAVFLHLRQQGIGLKPEVANTTGSRIRHQRPDGDLPDPDLHRPDGRRRCGRERAAWTIPAGFIQQFRIGALLGLAGGH